MPEAFICDFVRTPIGRCDGGLRRVRADDLAEKYGLTPRARIIGFASAARDAEVVTRLRLCASA